VTFTELDVHVQERPLTLQSVRALQLVGSGQDCRNKRSTSFHEETLTTALVMVRQSILSTITQLVSLYHIAECVHDLLMNISVMIFCNK